MDPQHWDAATYDALPLPHERWGLGVVERLGLTGDETVVDLGCGTGRDVERLLDRLPRGRVVAVDGSARMLAQLRDRLVGRIARVSVVHADLTQPFPAEVRGDAAMSVATFHWLPDHPALFGRIAGALPAGGRLEAEWGGPGNVTGFLRALEAAGAPLTDDDWNFADAAATAAALEAAGFADVDVRVRPDPLTLDRGPQLDAYIATVLLPAPLRNLPEAEVRALVRRTADAMPEPVVDYVRLEASARMP